MELIYSKYINLLMKINIVVFLIINIFLFIKDPSKADGFFIALTGILAVSFQFLDLPFFSIFYIISSIMYGLIAFDYGLIGEGIANVFLSPAFNIAIFISEIRNTRNTDIHVKRENSSNLFLLGVVGGSVSALILLEHGFTLVNSVFSDWEAFGILAMSWGLYFSYKNKAIQWFFFFIRNGICLYLWHFINDRIHVEFLWVFYTINNFLCILDYTLTKRK